VTSFEACQSSRRATFQNCPQLDVISAPGGSNPVEQVLLKGHPGHNPLLDFLIKQAAGAKLVCSVCTGALLLAARGFLTAALATTNWAYKDVLSFSRVTWSPSSRQEAPRRPEAVRLCNRAHQLRARGLLDQKVQQRLWPGWSLQQHLFHGIRPAGCEDHVSCGQF